MWLRLFRNGIPVLAVVAAAVGCGSDADGSPDRKKIASNGTIPAALVGSWKFEQLGDQLCDDAGRCLPSIARVERLKLTGDARFEYSLYAESNFPPCKLVGHAQGKGAARTKGATLELVVAEGFVKKQDSCGKSFQTSEKGKTWTYTYALGRDGTLMLTNDEGTEVGPFERVSASPPHRSGSRDDVRDRLKPAGAIASVQAPRRAPGGT